jgi:hypothetical protein
MGRGQCGDESLDGRIRPMSGSVLVTVWVMRFRFVTVCSKGYLHHVKWYRLPVPRSCLVSRCALLFDAEQICKCSSSFNSDKMLQRLSVHKEERRIKGTHVMLYLSILLQLVSCLPSTMQSVRGRYSSSPESQRTWWWPSRPKHVAQWRI